MTNICCFFVVAFCSIVLLSTRIKAFTQRQHTFCRNLHQGFGNNPCIPVPSNQNSPVLLHQSFDDDDDTDDDENRLSDEELARTTQEWDNRIARFNTVHLSGRVGNEPEATYFDDGKVVVKVNLATKRKYIAAERKFLGLKTGEEETDWYALEIWGATGEFVANYVEKGTRVSVVGSLQVDEWKDKATGEPRTRPKVIVRDFDVLESKSEAELRRSKSSDSDFFGGPSSSNSKANKSQFFD